MLRPETNKGSQILFDWKTSAFPDTEVVKWVSSVSPKIAIEQLTMLNGRSFCSKSTVSSMMLQGYSVTADSRTLTVTVFKCVCVCVCVTIPQYHSKKMLYKPSRNSDCDVKY